jgi:branched-subunit amino acid aminotransferase/4-amino-4-deoxychorismate lyase
MSGGERRRLIETMLWEAERGIDLLDEHAQRLATGLARCGVSAEDIPDKAQLLQAVETRLSASTEYPRTRVRMVYDPCHAADCLDRAEFRIEEAQPRNISRVGIIEFAGAKYSCKWEDRRIFSDLHRRFPGFDEIILTRGGLITDGSWTNIYWIPDNLGSARPLTPALPPAARYPQGPASGAGATGTRRLILAPIASKGRPDRIYQCTQSSGIFE